MPNQMPYGFMNQSYFTPNPNENPFMNQNYNYNNNKINELEQRISILEDKVKQLENITNIKPTYDYKTSMNMM